MLDITIEGLRIGEEQALIASGSQTDFDVRCPCVFVQGTVVVEPYAFELQCGQSE